jgi:hypothetical protein
VLDEAKVAQSVDNDRVILPVRVKKQDGYAAAAPIVAAARGAAGYV